MKENKSRMMAYELADEIVRTYTFFNDTEKRLAHKVLYDLIAKMDDKDLFKRD